MKNVTVVSHKQRLDALFNKINALNQGADDQELIAHWSRYLCVLVSGFLETSVQTIISAYVLSRTRPEVAKFVNAKMCTFTNAKMEKILQLAGEFDHELRKRLDEETKGELKAAVDSVVTNRHQIAHGRDVQISFVQMKKYYHSVLKVVEILEQYFPGKEER